MKQIFQEIDAINWGKLEHAYGEADDIPQSLKDLISRDNQEKAAAALSSFFANIYHQGTIYSATSYAVPFLIVALDTCFDDLKNDVLELLVCIANGMSYNIQHESFYTNGGVFDDGRVETQAYKDETKEQLHWVEQGIINVWDGWDKFVALLNHKDERIRAEISLLLTSLAVGRYFPKNRNKKKTTEALRQLFLDALNREKSASVRGSLILGIDNLEFPEKKKKIAFLNYYLKDEDALVRTISAYMILDYEVNELAIENLLDAARNKDKIDEIFVSVPWFDMRFSFSLLAKICRLPMSYFDKFWIVLDEFIKGTYEFCAEYTVTPIIRMVFGNTKIHELELPLTQPQKKVLESILNTPTLWIESDGNTSGEFRKWGLERNKAVVRKLI